MAYSKENIKSAVATIEKIVVKNNRVSILTQGDVWYSFFQTDQSGKMTSPQSSFQTQNVREGMSCIITYTEKTFSDGRIFKNAISFTPNNPGSVVESQTQPVQQSAPQGAPVATQSYAEKYEDEVIGKMVFGFIQAEIDAGAMTIKGANNGPYVAEAIMLAERIQNDCKGPRRQKIMQKAMREAHVPQQASEADLSGPWDEHINSNMAPEEDESEPWAV